LAAEPLSEKDVVYLRLSEHVLSDQIDDLLLTLVRLSAQR
jgi:hypothetical protein